MIYLGVVVVHPTDKEREEGKEPKFSGPVRQVFAKDADQAIMKITMSLANAKELQGKEDQLEVKVMPFGAPMTVMHSITPQEKRERAMSRFWVRYRKPNGEEGIHGKHKSFEEAQSGVANCLDWFKSKSKMDVEAWISNPEGERIEQ